MTGFDWGQLMFYYDSAANVERYIQMAEGYDGRMLVDLLKQQLKPGATVLELGMGPGKDLALLAESFIVTGSDSSAVFLDRYRQQHPDADVVQLDAVEIHIDRRFDAVYSNKVLYHLTKTQLHQSFQRQARVLHSRGIALHSFWYGDEAEEYHGLHSQYHTEESLAAAMGGAFEIIESKRYAEMEAGDSLYVVLRKKG